jgi:hypothetical protein
LYSSNVQHFTLPPALPHLDRDRLEPGSGQLVGEPGGCRR